MWQEKIVYPDFHSYICTIRKKNIKKCKRCKEKDSKKTSDIWQHKLWERPFLKFDVQVWKPMHSQSVPFFGSSKHAITSQDENTAKHRLTTAV